MDPRRYRGGGGSGASPTLVVINDSGTMSGKDITVVSDNGLYNQTKLMESANYIIFELPWLGTYYIRWALPSGATTQQTAVVDSVGGITSTAAIPTITIINKNRSMDNKEFTVTSQNGSQTYNVIMPEAASVDVPVNSLTTYIISWNNNGVVLSENIALSSVRGSIEIEYILDIQPFATATEEQIASMVSMHYNNKLDLSQYWSVGDTRTINISSIASSVGSVEFWEAQPAQTQEIVILDFNHDTLSSTASMGGHTRAAVTIGLKNCLTNDGIIYYVSRDYYYWSTVIRRTWCQTIFPKALPQIWQSIIKEINVPAINYGPTLKSWLVSCNELTSDGSGEGYQYKYYEIAANRIKNTSYWTRTINMNTKGYYYFFNNSTVSSANITGHLGISPIFAI